MLLNALFDPLVDLAKDLLVATGTLREIHTATLL
jgi:hypothetical protein